MQLQLGFRLAKEVLDIGGWWEARRLFFFSGKIFGGSEWFESQLWVFGRIFERKLK
jgi:hypothetical protein